jgi:hypothetical protein
MSLLEIAAELGVTVIEGQLDEGWGTWECTTRTITLRAGMGEVQRRSVLARMVGHAKLGHEETSDAAELEAAEWAARHLIHPGRAAATLKAVNWIGLMARELEVMPADVAAYYESLTDEERLGIKALITMIPCGFPG